MPAFVAATFHRRGAPYRRQGLQVIRAGGIRTKCCVERQRPSARAVKATELMRARLELAASRRRLAELRELRKDVDERRRLRLAAHAPIVTLSLTIVMILMYILGVISPMLKLWYTKQWSVGGVKVLVWQPWRMIMASMIHRDFIHLTHNVVVFAALGCAAEMVYGAPAFITLFGTGALGGAVVGALSRPARINVSVGASGALHALAGALMAHLRVNRVALGKRAAATTFFALAVAIGVALVGGWKATGVDFAAHFGGLLVGCGVGAILSPIVTRVGNMARVKRVGWLKAIVVALMVGGVAMVLLVGRLLCGV